MQAITYLQFSGNAGEALAFYEKALGAEVQSVTFGATGNPELPEDVKAMVMDAKLTFGDSVIMLSDVPAFMGQVNPGNNAIISVIDGDPEENKAVFDALAAEGQVLTPLGEYPWSSNFGMVIDKFGVTWKFNADATSFLEQLS